MLTIKLNIYIFLGILNSFTASYDLASLPPHQDLKKTEKMHPVATKKVVSARQTMEDGH